MDHRERWASLHAADGRWIPPEPLPAATMVLRCRGRVLLLRRSETMGFAPGMHVFPGGGLAPEDLESADPLRACAIRETLEEVDIRVEECSLFDRWVTPESESRRYDVSFFIADVVEEGRLVTSEAVSMVWIDPSSALRLHARGELPMLRPTAVVLEDLAADRIHKGVRDVVPKLPRIRPDGAWDVVNAQTDEILATVDIGPTIAEADGSRLLG